MLSSKTPLIAVIGDINVDQTFTLPFFPHEGEDATAQTLRWGSGGTGINVATAFARLGARATLLGCVGSDISAASALNAGRAAGVLLDEVQHDERLATGICTVMVSPSGQRTFFSYRGANVGFAFTPSVQSTVMQADLLAISAYALLEGQQRTAAIAAIHVAIASRVPVMLDLCLPTIRLRLAEIMTVIPHLWMLSLNEAEMHALLPGRTVAQALDELHGLGVPHVAIKRGGQGCSVIGSGRRLDVLPPAVNVLDTTGCGDAFAAGYAWALLRGADLSGAAALGNLMGALTAARVGAADALPPRAELLAKLDHRIHNLITEL